LSEITHICHNSEIVSKAPKYMYTQNATPFLRNAAFTHRCRHPRHSYIHTQKRISALWH